MVLTCRMCNTNRSLGNSAKNAAISFQRYLTFITECSVTNQTLKVARNHCEGTKLEVSQITKLFIFFLSFFFFLEKAYLMTALSSNCAFNVKGQHFLACRSTVPQNLRNFNGSPQAKNCSPACLSIALELDAIFFLSLFTHVQTSRGTADVKFMLPWNEWSRFQTNARRWDSRYSQVSMWRWSWGLKRAMEGIWKLLSADWGCHQYLVRFVCIWLAHA